MDGMLFHTATVFMGFFAIMNPIANVPIFLGLTSEDDQETTKAVAVRSLLLAFLIIFLFCIAGKVIFQLFGITLPAFRISGGFLVVTIGFQMLHGRPSDVHHLDEEHEGNAREAALSVAVSPLAMPILAGPGTIATAMNFSAQGGLVAIGVTIAAFAVLCVITGTFFIFGEKFVSYIGTAALGVITRMMGLILAVIGTQMVIAGVKGAFNLIG